MRTILYYLKAIQSVLILITYNFKPVLRSFARTGTISNSPLYDDVSRWQKKQIQSMTYEGQGPKRSEQGKIDRALMHKIHRTTLLDVRHQVDGMWEVSTDTLRKGRGISLDQAIVLMHRLRDAGFPDSCLGVVSVQIGDRRHSFAIVQYHEKDFWMLDNGYFLNVPCRASKYLSRRGDIQYLIGFNFFDVWNY